MILIFQAKDAAESSKKMEDEWEDFERLISEKQVDNYIKKEKDMVYPSAVSNKDGEDRLKNLKFDVGNFVNHNETSRYSQDGKVIKEDTNETKEKDKDEKSKNDDKKDKYSPGDKRKRSRSHSKSRRHVCIYISIISHHRLKLYIFRNNQVPLHKTPSTGTATIIIIKKGKDPGNFYSLSLVI